MALYRNRKEITTIYRGNKHIAAIYYGANLVWQYVRSCFGKGFWINEKAWSNEDYWKNS